MRGGKREGSGRKRVKPERAANKATAEQILSSIPEAEYWKDLIEAKTEVVVGKAPNASVVVIVDKRLRLEVLKYLTDKRDGKAPLAMHHTSEPIVVRFTRDPQTPAIQVASTPKI